MTQKDAHIENETASIVECECKLDSKYDNKGVFPYAPKVYNPWNGETRAVRLRLRIRPRLAEMAILKRRSYVR